MTELFPFVYATVKADPYFTALPYLDTHGNFKVFPANGSPTDESPFTDVEIDYGDQDQRTGWAEPLVLLHNYGEDTEEAQLWAIADKQREIFQSTTVFVTVDGVTISYQLIGKPTFSRSIDPVTEKIVISVGLRFGIDMQ